MYSLMSMRIMAFSSSKRNSASARESSVLPTPVGPRKMNEPIGRFSSCKPARARRTAFETAMIAGFWPMTRCVSRSSIFTSFCALAFLQARDRNVRPARDHFGDVFLGHFFLAASGRPAASRRASRRARSSCCVELRECGRIESRSPSPVRRGAAPARARCAMTRAPPAACAVCRSRPFRSATAPFSFGALLLQVGQFFLQLRQALFARRDPSPSSAPAAPSRAA